MKDVLTDKYSLLFGNCLERMKEIPDGSVDLILTDPPFGTTKCSWDSVIPFEPMWAELKRIIKPNGAIVLFGSEPFSSALRISNIKQYKYDWIWDKKIPSGMCNAKIMPMKQSENNCVFLPELINLAIVKPKKSRDLPTGVSKVYKSRKFVARISRYGNTESLGAFSEIEDACNIYKEAKKSYIAELADKYKHLLDERAHVSLINYEV